MLSLSGCLHAFHVSGFLDDLSTYLLQTVPLKQAADPAKLKAHPHQQSRLRCILPDLLCCKETKPALWGWWTLRKRKDKCFRTHAIRKVFPVLKARVC